MTGSQRLVLTCSVLVIKRKHDESTELDASFDGFVCVLCCISELVCNSSLGEKPRNWRVDDLSFSNQPFPFYQNVATYSPKAN